MTRPTLSDAQPPRDKWRVELVDQKTESGLVLFEYVVKEAAKEPFLLNNHKAQIRTNHQRIVTGPSGGMMHVSGVEVLDSEAFEEDKEFYRWAGKDRSGAWRDDRGRTLAPFVFASAPWAGGVDEELDPQWQREAFVLDEASQVQECIDRYQKRAEDKGYVGDKRGTTLNLLVGANDDDCRVKHSTSTWASNFCGFGADAGSAYDAGMRFLNVTIAAGSTVNTVALTLQAKFNGSGTPCNATVYCQAADDAATFSTYAYYTGRATTTGTAWGSVATWTSNTDYSAPSFVADVQEVIDRGGWASGQDVAVLVKDNGSVATSTRTAKCYEDSTSLCARLDIDYTAGGGGGTVIPVFMNQYRQRWR